MVLLTDFIFCRFPAADYVYEIYGLHVWNYQKSGTVGVKSGPVMAAADLFTIKIQGIGGHGAAPQGTVDCIVVASYLVQALQTIVSRNTNPLDSTVVTVGQMNGGYNFNVIADQVILKGTTRAYTEQNRQLIKNRMQKILKNHQKSSKIIKSHRNSLIFWSKIFLQNPDSGSRLWNCFRGPS